MHDRQTLGHQEFSIPGLVMKQICNVQLVNKQSFNSKDNKSGTQSSMDNEPLLNVADQSVTENNYAASNDLSYVWKIFVVCANVLAYSLIGANVFIALWFAFKSSPISVFQLHIGLCVVGYQLLMAYGILSLNRYSGWSTPMTASHRRRAHWVLQLVGSGLAIAGSSIMINEKTVNFNSIHGKLALSALILTCISLCNGVMTLYRVGLERVVPAKVIKTSHLFLGTAAFALSSVCLAFGYNKKSFKEWGSTELAYVMIGVTSTYTLIIIAKPCYIFWKKFTEVMKIKIF